MKLPLLAACLLASTCAARAATIVVDNQHPRASDASTGTRQSPLKTIGAAARKAQAGDEVLVRAGTYREAIALVNSGRLGAPIVFRSEVPRAAIISGSDLITSWKAESPGVWSCEVPRLKKVPYLSGNADWIYADGFPLQEAPEQSQIAPGSFLRDFEAKRILVAPEEGQSIQNLKVEYASREGLISCAGPLDDGVPNHAHGKSRAARLCSREPATRELVAAGRGHRGRHDRVRKARLAGRQAQALVADERLVPRPVPGQRRRAHRHRNDGFNLLRLEGARPQTVLLRFYHRGKALRNVTLGAVRLSRSNLRRTISHYAWREEEGFDKAGHFIVETIDRRRLIFDVRTGRLLGTLRLPPVRWEALPDAE